MVWKTLVAQQRTNVQLNSHMTLAGNRTGVTLVRRVLYAQPNHATLWSISHLSQIKRTRKGGQVGVVVSHLWDPGSNPTGGTIWIIGSIDPT